MGDKHKVRNGDPDSRVDQQGENVYVPFKYLNYSKNQNLENFIK